MRQSKSCMMQSCNAGVGGDTCLASSLAGPICSEMETKLEKGDRARLHRAQRFHQGLRKLLVDENQERGPRALHPKWGRLLPQHRFNWDEIPLAFIGGLSHTWAPQVSVSCVNGNEVDV